MIDIDFSLALQVKETLDAEGVEYDEQMVGGLIYILVENNNHLAMFVFYGFFEEYVIYERTSTEANWVLKERQELNLNFISVNDVLDKIGIIS